MMSHNFTTPIQSRAGFIVFVLGAVLSVQATVIKWTNSNNGNWNVAANWTPNQVPSTHDVALITNAGTYVVTLNVSPTIAGLVLGGSSGTQTLSTAEQVLTLNGSGSVGTHGVFKLSLGTLSGVNHLDVGGTLVWDGGTIDTNAAVTIASSGQMLIGPGAISRGFFSVSLPTRARSPGHRPVGFTSVAFCTI